MSWKCRPDADSEERWTGLGACIGLALFALPALTVSPLAFIACCTAGAGCGWAVGRFAGAAWRRPQS